MVVEPEGGAGLVELLLRDDPIGFGRKSEAFLTAGGRLRLLGKALEDFIEFEQP